MFEVRVLDGPGGNEIFEVQAGSPVVLEVTPYRKTQIFTNTVEPTAVSLQSGFVLLTPDAVDTINEIPGGVNGRTETNVMFTRVPSTGAEYVAVAGSWIDGSKVIAFLGSSDAITVRPGPAETIAFQDPPSGMPKLQNPGEAFNAKVQAFDHWGNKADQATPIKCISLKPDIGNVVSDTIADTDSTGMARFTTQVTMGGLYDTFPLVATLPATGDLDTAYMVVGLPRDRLFIFFDADQPFNEADEIHGCAGERVPVTIRASKDGVKVSTDRVTSFTIDLSSGLAAYADETSTTKITTSQLAAGEAVIWIQAVAKNVSNGTISAIPADGAVKEYPHSGIFFDPCYKIINHAAYFADDGTGSVNRVEIYYDSALAETEVPDSIRLFWPDEMTGVYMARGDEIVLDANDPTHITVTLTQPFPEAITRYGSGGREQLGTTLWSNPLTPEVTTAQPQQFAIDDSVGPLLASATLIERVSAGDDSLVITFTESVPMDIAGASLILIQGGSEINLNVSTSGLYSDGKSIVAVIPEGTAVPAEGDSLRINPAGPVIDDEGNHAHLKNRPVVITLSKVPPSILSAVYQDQNGDGIVDNVKITFNKAVDLNAMFLSVEFDGIKGARGENVGAEYFTSDEVPNTVNFRIDGNIFIP
ncbi:MAG: hypothetical protein OQK82_09360, partial [Candidatus Pacearchaeota archaeon]|nr:hypothetical protein [Candidatus Pacearchaeota archaeon]